MLGCSSLASQRGKGESPITAWLVKKSLIDHQFSNGEMAVFDS
jgi:hypothetical protein